MSELNYRNKQNEPISFSDWFTLKLNEVVHSVVVDVGGNSVTVNKKYFGTIGSVFKVWVECTSDLDKYHGYKKHFDGEVDAENDFARIVSALTEGEEIFDLTLENGQISIYYDVRFDQHIVIDNRNYPEIDYCFNTRSEAETKYNQLIGE